MNSISWIIAKRYLLAQRRNFSSGLIALFSALGVTVGTWLLIFVLSASNGFENEVKAQLMGKDAHFELTQYGYAPMGDFENIRKTVLKNRDVLAASPYIMSQAVFAKKKKFSGGVVIGIDPIASLPIISLKKQVTGGMYNLDSVRGADGKYYSAVIMGYALANRLQLEIGDKCLLYVFGQSDMFEAALTPKVKIFVLTGTFESGMYQFDETLSYVNLGAAQQAFAMEHQITGIHGQIKNPYQSRRVSKAIEDSFGYPYSVIDWQEKNKTLIKWMDYEKALMGLALGIIVIIAAFNIISSLVMNVNDKKREIGILRTMGASQRRILLIFIIEGLLIGVIGSCLGLILGLGSCYLQHRFGFITLPGDVYFVTRLPIRVEWPDVVMIVIITNLLCMIASIIPAFRASRQNPVDSIRYE